MAFVQLTAHQWGSTLRLDARHFYMSNRFRDAKRTQTVQNESRAVLTSEITSMCISPFYMVVRMLLARKLSEMTRKHGSAAPQ
jgi:hypothetical protein